MRPGVTLLTLYVAIVAATSLRLPFTAGAVAAALLLAHPPRFIGALRYVPAAAVLALAGLGFALHAATRHVVHPNTGPDAMVVPVLRLLRGQQPFASLLWDGAPISRGPGWLLLNAPLTASGLIILLTPAWLAVAAALLRGKVQQPPPCSRSACLPAATSWSRASSATISSPSTWRLSRSACFYRAF